MFDELYGYKPYVLGKFNHKTHNEKERKLTSELSEKLISPLFLNKGIIPLSAQKNVEGGKRDWEIDLMVDLLLIGVGGRFKVGFEARSDPHDHNSGSINGKIKRYLNEGDCDFIFFAFDHGRLYEDWLIGRREKKKNKIDFDKVLGISRIDDDYVRVFYEILPNDDYARLFQMIPYEKNEVNTLLTAYSILKNVGLYSGPELLSPELMEGMLILSSETNKYVFLTRRFNNIKSVDPIEDKLKDSHVIIPDVGFSKKVVKRITYAEAYSVTIMKSFVKPRDIILKSYLDERLVDNNFERILERVDPKNKVFNVF